STCYQVSVVLIDSTAPTGAALPVLTRDLAIQPGLVPPFPALDAALPPAGQASVRLAETLTLTGRHLDGGGVMASFSSSRLASPIRVDLGASSDSRQLQIVIDDDPAKWHSGIYGVSVTVSRQGQPERTTNELPFTLAPRIEDFAPKQATGIF